MAKTRLDQLLDADIDYSMPINTFADHARKLFNRMARKSELKTRVYAAEYNDGAARLYLRIGDDWLAELGDLFFRFEDAVIDQALENTKLRKLDLPIKKAVLNGDEILLEF